MPDTPNRHFGSLAILIASLCIALVVMPSHWVRLAEREQQAAVAQVLGKDASGQIHIVEIDARSIDAVRHYPWPRDHYARLVRLLDAAGVRSIVFDIDFSSEATRDGDAAFSEAISEASASIVLPTFSQLASETSDQRIDALPIAILRDHASLASVSVRPDDDARVRRMPYGTMTLGTPRPSLSSQIAGVNGAADVSFPIDYGIDPASIPRHSFIDIEGGDFDPATLAGKDVLIGATAIELGDRYGVPTYGVIPGVTIQALAAETLMAGGLGEYGPVPLLAVALILIFLIVRAPSYVAIGWRASAAFGAILALEIVAYHGGAIILDLVPATIAIAVAALGQAMRVARAQLRERARIDSETGLPNALGYAAADQCENQFVVAACIKDFESIQAVLGKDKVGDFILRLVERISDVHPVTTVYRAETRMIAWVHSGDFAALVEAFDAVGNAMRRPVLAGGHRIDVSLTFGIAPADNLAAAIRAASHAAKEDKPWHAHEAAEATIIEQRVSLMGELDQAIEAGQLSVVYQPKLRLATDQIESVEALVRWNHPERGFLRPDLFIPLAEENNRITALTLVVLRQTIADLARWCREGAVVSVAVNISARLVSSDDFVNVTEQILRQTGVPRERLIFEVTESATMRDPESAGRNLERFRALGVGISMDDYGTGQSSLSYLQKLPLTEIKVDRAFVQQAHIDRSDGLMVRSTIQLAHSLGLKVVCEGVEDEGCLEFLRANGCDYAQGYFISKPLPAADLQPLLPKMQEQANFA